MESNVICQGFLEQETCDILEKHFDLQKELGRCTYGDVNKIPQGKSFDLYGDSFCEAIGVHKTAYINKGNKWDLNALYRRLKAGNGEVLEVGSREWFKVITDHLNKAYGVAGVGTVGSQIE